MMKGSSSITWYLVTAWETKVAYLIFLFCPLVVRLLESARIMLIHMIFSWRLIVSWVTIFDLLDNPPCDEFRAMAVSD
ncbi:unnamed protein product [Prunus armeniaca]